MKQLRTAAQVLTRLGTISALVVSSNLAAELLTLEENGATQIMAKIRATMSGETAKAGESVPWEFSYQQDGADKIVYLDSHLPLTVKQDGEPLDISLYRVKVNHDDALLTLSSEEDADAGGSIMMIGYPGATNNQATRFHANFSEHIVLETEVRPEHPRQIGEEGHKIDIELNTPQELLPTENEIGILGTSSANQPLTIFVFKHDDVQETVSSLIHEHFSWWVKHMNDISEEYRKTNHVPLFSELVIDFRTDSTIQSFKYRGEPRERLKELAKEMRRYKKNNGILGSFKRNKFLLMTEKMMDWKTLGIAYQGGEYAMAADDDEQVAAHEIGHMLNGRHDKADVIYNGWWCESILYWQHIFLRASCHYYTDANKDAITDYLK
ncbi:hypothetical protein [Sansalvadorimonas verongulae]|uniref:hypothetical protein n=1 Tax=Sansalvadorimonas verongulae TaxID=2172824 RepID=UPI0012BD698B|nr:hypothetical protein [Sansalvadorimonas verongulae]MTI11900.1 hypothetical protein [Sansalvadorimonas verongulae]